MATDRTSRWTLVLALACGCACSCNSGDGPKPAPDGKQGDAVQTSPGGSAAAQPSDGAAAGPLKGLDPTPPLSRTDMGNGLIIEDLKMGAGEIVWPGARVRLAIRGWSVATGKMYWDTAAQNEPVEVALNTAMKGMREGVPGMRVGGKRRLSIPPDKAYGFMEVKNEKDEVVVPQVTPIVVEVEVLEVLSKLKVDAPANPGAQTPAQAAPSAR